MADLCILLTGLMSSAWDIGGLSSHLVLSYLGSKGHKTRWVAAGIALAALSCFLRLVPHLVFGPGQDALELTLEYEQMYGGSHRNSSLSNGMNNISICVINNF